MNTGIDLPAQTGSSEDKAKTGAALGGSTIAALKKGVAQDDTLAIAAELVQAAFRLDTLRSPVSHDAFLSLAYLIRSGTVRIHEGNIRFRDLVHGFECCQWECVSVCGDGDQRGGRVRAVEHRDGSNAKHNGDALEHAGMDGKRDSDRLQRISHGGRHPKPSGITGCH